MAKSAVGCVPCIQLTLCFLDDLIHTVGLQLTAEFLHKSGGILESGIGQLTGVLCQNVFASSDFTGNRVGIEYETCVSRADTGIVQSFQLCLQFVVILLQTFQLNGLVLNAAVCGQKLLFQLFCGIDGYR